MKSGLPLLVIATGYDLVRSQASSLIERAVVEPQLRFDEIVFGGTAPTVLLQRALVDRGRVHAWDYGAFVFYLSHFVVTPLAEQRSSVFGPMSWALMKTCA